MSKSGEWTASLLEQRLAWGIAASCIILVLLASARPAWFDFSTAQPKQTARQATKQALPTPAKPVAAKPHKTHLNTRTKAHKVHAKTTSKPSTSPSPPIEKKHTIAEGFYVQFGAFRQRFRAQGLADQLQRKGWRPVIANTQGGLHAVWVGPKKTRNEAEKLRKAIHLKFKNKGFIVHKKQA
ncbi:MAG: SPOR domain-containing protein [Mariprofundus sp.]|nr:SPOR domain-containing protein [Mariprofundus sp.]